MNHDGENDCGWSRQVKQPLPDALKERGIPMLGLGPKEKGKRELRYYRANSDVVPVPREKEGGGAGALGGNIL